jgi:hypothetical protein
VACLLGASSAKAVTWRDAPDSLNVVIRMARLAFRGEVVSITPAVVTTPSGKQVPHLDVVFRVLEAYEGTQVGNLETVRQIGGPVPGQPGMHLFVSGVPEYQVGGHYTVFADRTLQRLSGTLWGTLSTHRIVRIAEERDLVITYSAHPLKLDAEGRLQQVLEWRCVRERERPNECRIWRHRDGSIVSSEALAKELARWLDRRAFDRAVLGVLAEAELKKAQADETAGGEKGVKTP